MINYYIWRARREYTADLRAKEPVPSAQGLLIVLYTSWENHLWEGEITRYLVEMRPRNQNNIKMLPI